MARTFRCGATNSLCFVIPSERPLFFPFPIRRFCGSGGRESRDVLLCRPYGTRVHSPAYPALRLRLRAGLSCPRPAKRDSLNDPLPPLEGLHVFLRQQKPLSFAAFIGEPLVPVE